MVKSTQELLSRQVQVLDDKGTDEWIGPLWDLLQANQDGLSDAEVRKICNLAVGEECVLGGGAAPLFTIRMVS